MTFRISPAQLTALKTQLIGSHQVVITGDDSAGTITTVDGQVSASYSYDGHVLEAEITHNKTGYPDFIVSSGLNSKIAAALKALPA